MLMKKISFLILLTSNFVISQIYFPTNSQVKSVNNSYQAYTNATIHVSPYKVVKNATLLEKDGIIIAVGQNIDLPENTRIYDKSGKHIYASFIDLMTEFGIKKPIRNSSTGGRSAEYNSSRQGYYWNDHILSEYNSIKDYKYDKKMASKMRGLGFGIVNAHRSSGIHSGTGILVALNDHENDNKRLISKKSSEHYSFEKSVTSNQSYPSSIMGSMALIRQFYYDSKWYSDGNSKTKDLSIEAFLENKMLPKIFNSGADKLNTLRAHKIGNELEVKFIILGSGKEYENINTYRQKNLTLILPLNFPKAFNVIDPQLTKQIPINKLRYWNQAPSNPKTVSDANIPFVFTTSELVSINDFKKNIEKAVKYGLSPEIALKALTTLPAKILGMESKIGKLQKNALANFIVTSGPIFQDKTVIYENWVQGKPHIIKNDKIINIDGEYLVKLNKDTLYIKLNNSVDKIAAKVTKDSISYPTKSSYKDGWLFLTIIDKKENKFAQLTSKINLSKQINGTGVDFNGNAINWKTNIKKSKEDENDTTKKRGGEKYYPPLPVTYPNNGYGNNKIPQPQDILFKNATVWTNEAEGIIENTDVLVTNGIISKIGKLTNIPTNLKIIDATGKHLTSGIIDEHSHIAASSINEGGQNSSAEVSIEDVINPDDINIFRNLAGGVTTIQILHGSANPIGGRSAIIKLKWGESIENMIYPNADPFIKFALGENVKQSNWGSFSRFPQTRMGVEQVFTDYFQRAKEYGENWVKYNDLTGKKKLRATVPRYDVEMEVLWEILRGDRFVSCHSYVQSEINMLMKVAEKFNFRINTFTHILEGYKVSDKMYNHGVGASTFSDWWAYKFEVNDAIPYNGAIMHNAGVLVAYNSDSAEMSRRLNQEAAKAVKYGGISEEDAWKFVTLNPAKLLHIDDKVGSIKIGKNADLVLWSDHPMSVYAIAEKTLIEGAIFYSSDEIPEKTKNIEKERNLLIGQMLNASNKGGENVYPKRILKKEFYCETLD